MGVIVYVGVLCDYDIIAIIVFITGFTGSTGNRPPRRITYNNLFVTGNKIVIHMELNVVYNEDCLEGMNRIEDKSVDMILCDLPYGVTACKWDTIIPFEPLWKQYERIITDTGCICLFGTEPFSTYLRVSNIKLYKYDWIWEKGRASGCFHAKNKPLKAHENISIFSKGTTTHKSLSDKRMFYEPIMEKGKPYTKKITNVNTGKMHIPSKSNFDFVGTVNNNDGVRYPRSVLKFSIHNAGLLHPTQKPVALCEYLIKTYTKEGDIVLDNCMGSGTTAIACMNTNRNFIGFELDKGYYDVILERIKNHKPVVIQKSKQGLEAWF